MTSTPKVAIGSILSSTKNESSSSFGTSLSMNSIIDHELCIESDESINTIVSEYIIIYLYAYYIN